MLNRFVAFAVALFLLTTTAQAHPVALVIGQNAHPGGGEATLLIEGNRLTF
jgi:hypothetical protein